MIVVVCIDFALQGEDMELFEHAKRTERGRGGQRRRVQLRAERLLYAIARKLAVVAFTVLNSDGVESVGVDDQAGSRACCGHRTTLMRAVTELQHEADVLESLLLKELAVPHLKGIRAGGDGIKGIYLGLVKGVGYMRFNAALLTNERTMQTVVTSILRNVHSRGRAGRTSIPWCSSHSVQPHQLVQELLGLRRPVAKHAIVLLDLYMRCEDTRR